MKKLFYTAVASFLFSAAIVPTGALGQTGHQTAKNLGLGGGGTAYLNSYHANFVNPANLMLGQQPNRPLSIGILGGLSTRAGGALANTSLYNTYFTHGLVINDNLSEEVLDRWFGSGTGTIKTAGVQAEAVLAGVSYQHENWAWGTAVRARAMGNAGSSRGTAELALYGLDEEIFSEPRAVNFSMDAFTFYELSAGVSSRILFTPELWGFAKNVKIYAGAAPKLILGNHTSSITFRSTLQMQGVEEDQVDVIRHEFTYAIETTGALAKQLTDFYNDRRDSGKVPDISNYLNPDASDAFTVNAAGVGVDLGVTAEMDIALPFVGDLFNGAEQLRVGLSLSDVGRVGFSQSSGRFVADNVVEFRGFDIDQERIDREFDGDRAAYFEYVLRDSIATEIYGSFRPEDAGQVSRSLPAMVSLGGQLVMDKLSFVLDMGKGLTEVAGSRRRAYLATGLEYRLLDLIPLRIGMRTGGNSSASYSAGIGLELTNIAIGFSASSVNKSEKRGTNVGAAWSGITLRF